MRYCTPILGVLLVVFSVVSRPAVQPGQAEAIAALRSQWVQDLHNKQLDAIVLLYSPDAVFLEPNGERIQGRTAIRELTRKAMESFTSDIVLQSLGSESSGDLAYDSGEFRETLTMTSGGKRLQANGCYLMVLKRQSDGKWLIAQQVWTEARAGEAGQGH